MKRIVNPSPIIDVDTQSTNGFPSDISKVTKRYYKVVVREQQCRLVGMKVYRMMRRPFRRGARRDDDLIEALLEILKV